LQEILKVEAEMAQSSLPVFTKYLVYVWNWTMTTPHAGSIQMLTTLKNTASFLKAVGKLSTAFSVHEKHQSYNTRTMDEAIAPVTQCNDTLQENEEVIRQRQEKLPKSLNGPAEGSHHAGYAEGSISAKTMKSIFLLQWGLAKLKSNLDDFDYIIQPIYSAAWH
jgi:hypothetical protein